jgi:hypothetical protein
MTEELGGFVDGVFADESADACDSGVVFDLEDRSGGFVVIGEFEASGFGVDVHGSEFEKGEGCAVLSDTCLAVQDRSG